ncbi:tetratricopeptide repeat protein [Tenacibaculum retecalamus]|uniref:hypothetical protein n=1 Tax=Tenacibaculum retecalamus TaxID=3018315 RepID=UPI0023D92B09|nr:hypothetical protein [Tenacibaculum retecalamus]WBX70803.1 hypothetical protein PG912_11310 [Tenacibaculum retecalamus]
MISFFKWYEIKDTHKFNNPETSTEDLLKIIKNQEERYLKHFGYFTPPFDEELLIMSGYMFLDMKQVDKSLTFFKLATEYYPDSANTFDSLADYYIRQKDYKKALENVTKAYQISKSEFHLKRMKEFKDKLKGLKP